MTREKEKKNKSPEIIRVRFRPIKLSDIMPLYQPIIEETFQLQLTVSTSYCCWAPSSDGVMRCLKPVMLTPNEQRGYRRDRAQHFHVEARDEEGGSNQTASGYANIVIADPTVRSSCGNRVIETLVFEPINS